MNVRSAFLGAASLVFVSSMARAETKDASHLAPTQMSEDMHAYFAGEKRGGIFFMTAGVAALVGGGASFAQKTDFYRGFAYPVIIVGVIETLIGGGLYLRTDARVARLDRSLATEPAVFRRGELERITGVNKGFGVLEIVEVGLALGGAGLGIVGGIRKNDTLKGVGLGLAIQSSAMLTLDLFAARRAELYAESLDHFDSSVAFRPSIAPPAAAFSALLVDRNF